MVRGVGFGPVVRSTAAAAEASGNFILRKAGLGWARMGVGEAVIGRWHVGKGGDGGSYWTVDGPLLPFHKSNITIPHIS